MDDGEPRYVSGVSNKTTCNDIIKALIDEELRNSDGGNYCGNPNNYNPKGKSIFSFIANPLVTSVPQRRELFIYASYLQLFLFLLCTSVLFVSFQIFLCGLFVAFTVGAKKKMAATTAKGRKLRHHRMSTAITL